MASEPSQKGLWPREKPRPTDSEGEMKVFEALSKQLPRGWTAWHSLRLRTDQGVEGEGDFVLAIPGRGMLILEVKGGLVGMQDGRWLQNGRPLDCAPREQAHSFAKKLLARLKELGSLSVPYGILTIFPDTAFSAEPDQDDLRGTILGKQDLPWLAESIEAKLDRAFPEDYLVPESNWPALLHKLWGETWVPRIRLGHRAELNAEERYQLDQTQVALIDSLAGNNLLLVEGVAGSGKTVMAREAAVREAEQGHKVLLLCFTDALAQWLSATLPQPEIQVSTLPRFAVSRLREQGLIAAAPATPEEWKDVSLRAACEALPALAERPDVVIVDEAQDLTENDWLLVEELARGSRLWVFHDPAQAFWEDRQVAPWVRSGATFCLGKSYRCPQPILEFSKALQGQPHDAALVKEGLSNGTIGLVGCPSESSVLSKVENEITKLRSEGFAPEDIVVLSLRGRTAAGSVSNQEKIGGIPVVRADSMEIGNTVIADTFLRFKGLERPAVIVTDLRMVKDRFDVRMHIALSRALDVVRVVGTKESIYPQFPH